VNDRGLGWDSIPPVAALNNHGSGPAIYFVGDSFTHSAKWPEHAQTAASDRGIDFVGYNLGVSGYGVTQSFLKVQRHFDDHRPALVVLQTYPWNDLRDDYPYPSVFYSPERSRRPFFRLEAGQFRLHPTPPEGWVSSLLGRTEVYQRVLLRAYLRTTKILADRDIDRFSRHEMAAPLHYHERAG
jgi:hypothetical protein